LVVNVSADEKAWRKRPRGPPNSEVSGNQIAQRFTGGCRLDVGVVP
jgi:hypothetical protein